MAQVQLQAHGLPDQHLTVDPEITFWKMKYARHTPFAKEQNQQTFDGVADFGRRASLTIQRTGDMVGPVWVQFTVPDLLAYDITPTPPDGNSIDVSATLQKDVNGNYWQSLSGGTYTNPVAFLIPGTVTYAPTATLTVGNTTQAVVSFNGTVYSGSSITSTSCTPSATTLQTWPYLCKSGSSVPFTYTQPTHGLRWVNAIGHALIKQVEILIGGTSIDRHTGEWLDIWSELTEPEEKRRGFWEMIGKYSDVEYDAGWQRAQSRGRTFYVPLRFSFNTTPGLYLPLLAMINTQIKYNFEFRSCLESIKSLVPITSLTSKTGGLAPTLTVDVWAEYVYLDSLEKLKMVERPIELLITQVQFPGDEAVPSPADLGVINRKFTLSYNHAVRALYWVWIASANVQPDPRTGNNWLKYDVPNDPTAEIFDACHLVLDGHARFEPRDAKHFRLQQPYAHHTRCPTKRVHCYPFTLRSPEDLQPNGQINMSRFEQAALQFKLNPTLPAGRMKIFALSYNTLRIAEGRAGLAFTL